MRDHTSAGNTPSRLVEVLLNQLRRDAFVLEATNYHNPKNPVLPSPWNLKAFFDQLVHNLRQIVGPHSFCLSINQAHVRADLLQFDKIAFMWFPGQPRGHPEEGKPIDATDISIESSFNPADAQRSAFFQYFKDWLELPTSKSVIFAPYIVRENERIQKLQNPTAADILLAFQTPQAAGWPDGSCLTHDFLCTETWEQPVTAFADPTISRSLSLDRAYYRAMLVVGIPKTCAEDDATLRAAIEAFGIEFQLSWGYPELSAAKQDVESKQRSLADALQTQSKVMASVHDLKKALVEADHTLNLLNQLVTPAPEHLEALYTAPAEYIPPMQVMRYFNRWNFHHDWHFIAGSEEDFRAQFSCILLKHLHRNLPKRNEPWSDIEPWEQLRQARDDNRIKPYSTAFGAWFLDTVARVCDGSTYWTSTDADAYKLLKCCFHYPYKDSRRLTAALLALWAFDNRGSATLSQNVLLDMTTSYLWPQVDLLEYLHSLYIDFMNSECTLEVNVKTTDAQNQAMEIVYSNVPRWALEKIQESLQKKPGKVQSSLEGPVVRIKELGIVTVEPEIESARLKIWFSV